MKQRIFNLCACGTMAAALLIFLPCRAQINQPGAKDTTEDTKRITKIQRDIQRDQKQLQADQQRFGLSSPQAQRDQADLDRDNAKLAKLQADVLEDKAETARINSDRQQEKTLQAAVRSDREQLKDDLKQFGPNSPQVQADRTRLANDKAALAKVKADLRALRHEEKLEDKSEKRHARASHMPSLARAGSHGHH